MGPSGNPLLDSLSKTVQDLADGKGAPKGYSSFGPIGDECPAFLEVRGKKLMLPGTAPQKFSAMALAALYALEDKKVDGVLIQCDLSWESPSGDMVKLYDAPPPKKKKPAPPVKVPGKPGKKLLMEDSSPDPKSELREGARAVLTEEDGSKSAVVMLADSPKGDDVDVFAPSGVGFHRIKVPVCRLIPVSTTEELLEAEKEIKKSNTAEKP